MRYISMIIFYRICIKYLFYQHCPVSINYNYFIGQWPAGSLCFCYNKRFPYVELIKQYVGVCALKAHLSRGTCIGMVIVWRRRPSTLSK